jgi:hypothetical protein
LSDHGGASARAGSQIPADDLRRGLALAQADSHKVAHIGVVGDTYTILFTGDVLFDGYRRIGMTSRRPSSSLKASWT